MDADVQIVVAEMRAGFHALNQRVTELKDDTREDAQEMHRENKDRLVRIEDQCRLTNGRVSTLESEVRGVWQRIKELGRRGKGDVDPVDRPTLNKRDAIMIGLGGAGIIAAWKFVEFIVRLLQQVKP